MTNPFDSFLGKRKASLKVFGLIHAAGCILLLVAIGSEAWLDLKDTPRDILLSLGMILLITAWCLRFTYHVVWMASLLCGVWLIVNAEVGILFWLYLVCLGTLTVLSLWRGTHWDKIYGDDKLGRKQCPTR